MKLKNLITFRILNDFDLPTLYYSDEILTSCDILEYVFGVPVNIKGVVSWSIQFDDNNYAMISNPLYKDSNYNYRIEWHVTANTPESIDLVKQTISQRTKMKYVEELTVSAVSVWLELYNGKARLYEYEPVKVNFDGIETYISKNGSGHVGFNNTPTDLRHNVEEYVLIKKSKLDALISNIE